jgi:hypothetical protein
MSSDSGMILTGENQRTWQKTCPNATFPPTNPTWIALGVNLGLHGEKLVIYHLSYDMARHVDHAKLWSYILQI